MSISFAVHQKAMTEAYKAILDDANDMDWALFSYKGNNELYLEDSGEDGLGELETEFNSGKMQYAFVRVLDPNTQLKKFILIIWQGEGVPATKKGMCANHVNDVKRFFKAHHMSICVRNEEDVTEDEIMKQVTKTTANFTFVQPTAVGSCGPVAPQQWRLPHSFLICTFLLHYVFSLVTRCCCFNFCNTHNRLFIIAFVIFFSVKVQSLLTSTTTDRTCLETAERLKHHKQCSSSVIPPPPPPPY